MTSEFYFGVFFLLAGVYFIVNNKLKDPESGKNAMPLYHKLRIGVVILGGIICILIGLTSR